MQTVESVQDSKIQQSCTFSYSLKTRIQKHAVKGDIVFSEEMLKSQENTLWFDNNYNSPLQGWVDISCSRTCPKLQPLHDILHLQASKFIPREALTEIPTCNHSEFDVSLFSMMTKH